MNKCYYRIVWENYPSDATPLDEENLNKIDVAADEMDNRIISLDITKFDKSEAQQLVKYIEYDENTGIFKITHYNGASYTIDTLLEKLAINFDYDYKTQQLIITLSDGEIKYVDLSALITQYEFLNSDTIRFTVDNDGKVKAEVIEGSIEEKHLRPDYLADIKIESAKAEASQKSAAESAESAKDSALSSESWAHGGTGKRDGEDTDNSQYYSEQAKKALQSLNEAGNVSGVKGNEESAYRTGLVNITPQNIGAVPLSGGTMTGALTVDNGTNNIKIDGSGAHAYTKGNGFYVHHRDNTESIIGLAITSDGKSKCIVTNKRGSILNVPTDPDTLEESTPVFHGASDTATIAAKLGRGGDTSIPMTFHWTGKNEQPVWLWGGGTTGTDFYVYPPSSITCGNATNAVNAETAEYAVTAGSASNASIASLAHRLYMYNSEDNVTTSIMKFHNYTQAGTEPYLLWGCGTDLKEAYLYTPSSLSCKYATSAGTAEYATSAGKIEKAYTVSSLGSSSTTYSMGFCNDDVSMNAARLLLNAVNGRADFFFTVSSTNEANFYACANLSAATVNLGNSTYKWKNIYSSSSTIITSDRNEKEDIKDLNIDEIIKFILGLKPISFKFINGDSGRTHYGLISQDVEELLEELGMSSLDFAGFIKSPKMRTVEKEIEQEVEKDGETVVEKNTITEEEVVEGEYTYGLRYEEFISPLIKTVQILWEKCSSLEDSVSELQNDNTELKERIQNMESDLEAIKNKMGL